jgi:hypothetical protein
MDEIVNVKLLAHPVNWLIVWIVLMFGSLAFSVFHKAVTVAPPTDTK